MKTTKFKHNGGTITLEGFAQHETKELKERLTIPEVPVAVFNEAKGEYELVEEVAASSVVLDRTCLGLTKVGNVFKMVRVNYNIESLGAQVGEIVDLGTNVNIAQSKFSIKQMKEKI